MYRLKLTVKVRRKISNAIEWRPYFYSMYIFSANENYMQSQVPLNTQSADRKPAAITARLIKIYLRLLRF